MSEEEHAGPHRVLVDRGLYGDGEAKLTVAGYPTLLLGYELTRKLQRRMADLDRSALEEAHRKATSGRVYDAENEKVRRGFPLSPTEIGTLLVTGKIHDPEEVGRLSYHARSNSYIEQILTPLLADQLTSIGDGDERDDRIQYHWGHLPPGYAPDENVTMPRLSDYQHLEDAVAFEQRDVDSATVEDFVDEEVAEAFAESGGVGSDEDRLTDHEATLRELSVELGAPITVGGDVVYEDGDRHLLDDEYGGGSGDDAGADDSR